MGKNKNSVTAGKPKKESGAAALPAQTGNTADWLLLIILLFILIIVPLQNHLTPINHAGPTISASILDSGTKYEFASYYKFVWLLVGTALLLAGFVYKMLKQNYTIPRDYAALPAVVMFALVLLSGIFAHNITLSLVGHWDRHEGTLTQLSYLLVFFIAASIAYPIQKTRWFTYILYALTAVNAVLIQLYFYGNNILKSPLILTLFLPSGFSPNGLSAGSYINSTFGNPDFASGFGGMMTVMFLARAVLARPLRQRIIDLVFAVIAFSIVPASLATSGFFTIVAALPIVVVLLLLGPDRKMGALTGAAALLAFALVLFIQVQHNPAVWNKSMGFFTKTAPSILNTSSQAQNNNPAASQGQNASPPPAQTGGQDDFNLPPAGWSAGTGRTYIWRKTIELVEKRPILGYGLDNLPYYFPQDDPYKNSGLYDPNIIVDKPHNTYLDIAFGSGVLALLAFLALLLRHAWLNIKLLRHGIRGETGVFLAGSLALWCGYLIQGMFNDSTIGVSIVFWLLSGVSASVLKQELEKKQKSGLQPAAS